MLTISQMMCVFVDRNLSSIRNSKDHLRWYSPNCRDTFDTEKEDVVL